MTLPADALPRPARLTPCSSTAGRPNTPASRTSWPAGSTATSGATRRSGARPTARTSPRWRRSRPAASASTRALALVDDVLLPNNVALDHERFLAYIPAAPATTAALFDAVVGAWSFSGESWQEAGAAVAAENAALDVAAPRSPGCRRRGRVLRQSGGSAGNLSGLAVARDEWRRDHDGSRPRWRVACAAVGPLVGAQRGRRCSTWTVVEVDGDERGRLTGAALRAAVDDRPVCAVVASAGRHQHRAASTSSTASPTCAPSAGRGSTSTRRTAARRCACRSWPTASPASSGRLARHRPAQVAVLTARLRGPAVPRPGAGGGAPIASGRPTSTPSATSTSTRPTCVPPHPAGARAAVLVHPRRPRHGGRSRTAVRAGRRAGPAGAPTSCGRSAIRCAW